MDLEQAAALLGIRTWHSVDADDLAVLRELLIRRRHRGGGRATGRDSSAK